MREAQAAARFIHPNIVTALNAGERDGTHFLTMEYVDGSDLSRLANKVEAFSVSQVAYYIVQAARGLAFAHSKGVIHRDIRPANLLLDKDGTIKILDMGLARLDSPSSDIDRLTQSSQIIGTLDYTAPEQAINARLADARSDVYSLGCTMYQLLAGSSPYGGKSMLEKLLAHREQPIPSLNTGRNDVPAQLELIYLKMMAKEPADRYSAMAEVVADLERFGAGHKPSQVLPDAKPLLLDSKLENEPILVFDNNPDSIFHKPITNKHTNPTRSAAANKKLIAVGMGGVLVFLLIVAGIIVTLKTMARS
jgi:serine/threonine protein kinase